NTLQGPEFVVRSRDLGATWTPLNTESPATGGLVPPWMSIDPQTSRIWFVRTLPALCGARIDWSDDDGESWQTNSSVGCNAPGELAQGGEKLLEGPAPAGGPAPVGYPHVVYYCANGVDPAPSNLYCYRSLDGGRTFAFTHVFPDPPPPPGCSERHPSRPGVVGTDGVLYFPTVLCGALGVAVSRDEGASWQFRPIVDSGLEDIYTTGTTVDSHGNLYFAYRGSDDRPYLTFSTDHGVNWSTPIMVAAPGVRAVRRVAVTARKRGEVALAYLGTTDGAHFNGYITESHNVLSGKPRFWSDSVNDPSQPLVNAADSETFGDRFFYGGVAIGPDGTAWAGFHCAKTSACPGQRIGIVGRPNEALAVR
ncbi:MAG TPA: sialidase family protein, partial [Candidatus Binatia bacterium]|nr:sialidase family protein [Candidatus Binatia bacterium]